MGHIGLRTKEQYGHIFKTISSLDRSGEEVEPEFCCQVCVCARARVGMSVSVSVSVGVWVCGCIQRVRERGKEGEREGGGRRAGGER